MSHPVQMLIGLAMCALAVAPRELDRDAVTAALRAVYLLVGG